MPDERSALETEIARLQGENATLKKELLARGLPVPGVPGQSGAKPSEPELKLPSDAEVDKVMSFLEKAWRRLIEMGSAWNLLRLVTHGTMPSDFFRRPTVSGAIV